MSYRADTRTYGLLSIERNIGRATFRVAPPIVSVLLARAACPDAAKSKFFSVHGLAKIRTN